MNYVIRHSFARWRHSNPNLFVFGSGLAFYISAGLSPIFWLFSGIFSTFDQKMGLLEKYSALKATLFQIAAQHY
jgi:hypothetical protein